MNFVQPTIYSYKLQLVVKFHIGFTGFQFKVDTISIGLHHHQQSKQMSHSYVNLMDEGTVFSPSDCKFVQIAFTKKWLSMNYPKQ